MGHPTIEDVGFGLGHSGLSDWRGSYPKRTQQRTADMELARQDIAMCYVSFKWDSVTGDNELDAAYQEEDEAEDANFKTDRWFHVDLWRGLHHRHLMCCMDDPHPIWREVVWDARGRYMSLILVGEKDPLRGRLYTLLVGTHGSVREGFKMIGGHDEEGIEDLGGSGDSGGDDWSAGDPDQV